ncbi:flagellar filament capping protein FliD [Pseudomonas sp.]|uniref:flagellar filament capping protein FliD n=1 Tax=Pseudomonas sp. TaxID=306 RepID=UPI00299D2496|nr:flagellar filament capping protein FliD [Pseudomonas sp.]MDX1367060.1 flagellar filament capping protein FliD [Pseudomonas sp.]
MAGVIDGITGVNSGLPISNMVTAIVNAEKAPKEAQLARLEKSTTTKFSALGELKSALSAFQTAMKDLNSATLFEKRTAVSSNTSTLTASASKTATPGTYNIEVQSLATASKVATAAVAGGFSSGASEQTLTVKLGAGDTGTAVTIAAGSDLASTRDQLNAALKDQGISATIVNNPVNGESRLVFSSTETGADNDLIVTGTGNLSALDVDGSIALNSGDAGSAGYIVQAANAEFTIDGLALSSTTNKVSGAIADVDFELLEKTETGKSVTLTVGQDNDGVKASIKTFVDAYNKLISTSNKLTSVTKVGEDGTPLVGGLVGDSTVRNLLSGVRNELVNPSGHGGVRVLADLGITTQKDGTLKTDDSKLDTALQNDFDAVGAFFTGDTGLMSRVDKRIDGFIQTGGILDQRMKALESTRSDIKTQTENLNRRVEQMQTRLLAQFNAMDALVGQLKSTGDQLAQVFASLPGVTKKDS